MLKDDKAIENMNKLIIKYNTDYENLIKTDYFNNFREELKELEKVVSEWKVTVLTQGEYNKFKEKYAPIVRLGDKVKYYLHRIEVLSFSTSYTKGCFEDIKASNRMLAFRHRVRMLKHEINKQLEVKNNG